MILYGQTNKFTKFIGIFAFMKQKLGTFLKYFLSALLAVGLLYLSFRKVEWAEFWLQLQSCNWLLIILSMLAGALAFWVRGIRWKQILLPLDPGTRAITAINGVNISNVANMVIPFSGEFVRSGVVTKHATRDPETGKPLVTYDMALGTAALERCWDVLTVIILLIVLLIFRWNDFGNFILDKVWQPIVGRLHFAAWLLLGLVVLLFGAFIWAVKNYRGKFGVYERIYGVLHRLLTGFASCLKMRKKGLFFMYTAIIWGMYWLQMVFITNAMPPVAGLGVVDALFLMLIGSFASVLPVPGGFGAYHYIVSLAMSSVYGFPQAGVGIVYATLAHESQSVTMLLTGLASYVSELVRKK